MPKRKKLIPPDDIALEHNRPHFLGSRRGVCQDCGVNYLLRKDGRLAMHNAPLRWVEDGVEHISRNLVSRCCGSARNPVKGTIVDLRARPSHSRPLAEFNDLLQWGGYQIGSGWAQERHDN